jgi:hypothetical protein
VLLRAGSTHPQSAGTNRYTIHVSMTTANKAEQPTVCFGCHEGCPVR